MLFVDIEKSIASSRWKNLSSQFILLIAFLFLETASRAMADSGKQAFQGGNSLKCMALNIYHEARGESELGQVGVGMVTLNRANSRFFQPTICGVVYARAQFSWTGDKYSDVPKAGAAWNTANRIANNVISRSVADPTGHASHYYNPAQANPPWAKKMKVTRRIGHHVFLRMAGFGGGNSPMNWDFEEAFDPEALLHVGDGEGDEFKPSTDYEEFLKYVDSLPDVEEGNGDPRLIQL